MQSKELTLSPVHRALLLFKKGEAYYNRLYTLYALTGFTCPPR